MERLIFVYYQALYSPPAVTEDHAAAEVALLAQIPDSFNTKFPAEVLEALGRPPDELELKAGLQAMAFGKSPGPDGVLPGFFLKFWDLISHEFTAMIHSSILRGMLPPNMNKGLIVLLPKDGDLEEIKKWRPITLLNTSYKILAKTLQIRLQHLLPDIIHDGQSAFLPSRHILDSVMV